MTGTLASWIVSRTPPAPAWLSAHLRGFVRDRDANAVSEALLDAAGAALQRVLDSGAASRDAALDLLSADAFVTYAFESAADDPATIADRADLAMRQVSARAVTYLDRNAL